MDEYVYAPTRCGKCGEIAAVIINNLPRCGTHGLEDYAVGKVEHEGRVKTTQI